MSEGATTELMGDNSNPANAPPITESFKQATTPGQAAFCDAALAERQDMVSRSQDTSNIDWTINQAGCHAARPKQDTPKRR